jgi:NADH-quinone oxidoreductase subunit D/NADH-quinone oxidoreductase subunit C/D
MGSVQALQQGIGISCYVRKLYPYDGYDKLQFDEIIQTGGDSWAR